MYAKILALAVAALLLTGCASMNNAVILHNTAQAAAALAQPGHARAELLTIIHRSTAP
jgi:uncharacterized lipoprotein YajG